MIQQDLPPSALALRIGAWVAFVQKHAVAVLIVAALLGFGWIELVIHKLSVDTNNQNMLSAELPWRKADAEIDRLFPPSSGLVVVLDGSQAEAVADAQRRLVAALKTHPDQFSSVFSAETEPYFRKNGLLYLDKDSLQKLADQLMQAQPFLGTLGRDPSPHALFTLLDRAITAPAGAGDFDLSLPLKRIAETTSLVADGHEASLSWQALLGDTPAAAGVPRRFIQIAPVRDFSQVFPAQSAIETLRTVARELSIDEAHGVRMRVTGTIAMENEELQTAFHGTGFALGIALILVGALLAMALRSFQMVFATVVTLVYGLVATAAFAAVAIGHLNLISIAFGLLYIGLGIDYALYLCMQYRERLAGAEGLEAREAMRLASMDVGGFMLVCATTVSLAFLAFVPTSFTGIAELGLISGAGMFISLVASLTLLPAIIALLPAERVRTALPVAAGKAAAGGILDWPYRYQRAFWGAALVLILVSLWLAPRQYFDYDPLNLRDPKSEAVSTFRDLLKDPSVPTLTLSAVAGSAEEAKRLAEKIAAVPSVGRAFSLPDLVPSDQLDKLAILSDLSLNLSLQAPAALAPVDAGAVASDAAAMKQLRADLPDYLSEHKDEQGQAAQDLLDALASFHDRLEEAPPEGQAALWGRLQAALIGGLPAHLDDLVTALEVGQVSEADLPPQLANQWKSADGHYRVEIWPKEALTTPAAMERFIDSVRAVVPEASGAPVGFVESGRAVVSAFKHAFGLSFLAITLVLLVLMRSLIDTLLVLVPLLLAGLFTVAAMVAVHLPFNFANVIALPLVLGVGVDYGVYLVQRGRRAGASGENLLRTGPARAVFFGALITVANFGNLMLAKHPGMVGMGLLLTLGLGMTLVCALVLLPSLIAFRFRAR